jgi:hypothetical protein
MHSTNYHNAFIEVAEDSTASEGKVPPEKVQKSIARLQFELIHGTPYQHTSDDVIFAVHAARKGSQSADHESERRAFFSKGQPCLRCSPLAKTYGWGIHFDHESRVALYSRGSEEYQKFQKDSRLQHLKAMRTKRSYH